LAYKSFVICISKQQKTNSNFGRLTDHSVLQ
jgi:hypothetical protein